MLNLQSLQKIAGGLKSTVAVMRAANEALNAKITQFESDKTKSQSYITENIKAARDTVVAKAQTDLASMREAAEVAGRQVELWASREFQMYRLRFDADPATDASIRADLDLRLSRLSPPVLELAQRSALDDFSRDGSPASLATAFLAAQLGAKGDLSGVTIPEQEAALQAIVECDAALAEAELLLAGMSGQSMDPARKLTIGRRMQPNRPTSHNSPGRSVTL